MSRCVLGFPYKLPSLLDALVITVLARNLETLLLPLLRSHAVNAFLYPAPYLQTKFLIMPTCSISNFLTLIWWLICLIWRYRSLLQSGLSKIITRKCSFCTHYALECVICVDVFFPLHVFFSSIVLTALN